MASRVDDSRIARGSGEFVEASILDTLIISSSEAELRSQLESWDGSTPESSQSILPFASHRGFLLFGMLLMLDFSCEARSLTHYQAYR